LLEKQPFRQIRPIDALLGIDFGTRFTKVALNLPHIDQRRVLSLSEDTGKLFPSRILIDDSGHAVPPDHTWIQQGGTQIEYLKMRLARPAGEAFRENIELHGLPLQKLIPCLSALFLAGIIRQAQAAAMKAFPVEMSLGRTINWRANVGVPVKYHDSPEITAFQDVCGVAWLWKDRAPESIQLATLLNDYKSSLASLPEPIERAIQVAPELTAALAHFGENRNTAEGMYALFDIGGGTVDGTVFRLIRAEGRVRFSIFSAEVADVGTMVVARQAAQRFGAAANDIERAIVLNEALPAPVDLSDAATVKMIQCLFARVIITAKKTAGPAAFSGQLEAGKPRWVSDLVGRDPIVPVFLAGGGARSRWYSSIFERTHKDFNQQRAGIGGYAMRLLPPPPQYIEDDYPRFLIANGLSAERLLFQEYRLPSQTSQQSQFEAATTTEAISKDMV